MEKGNFPVVEMPAERSKKHVILTSWASVATALLLVVLIGGAFYVADLRGRQCDVKSASGVSVVNSDNTKTYEKTREENGEQTKEDYFLDKDSHTELIVKKSADGKIEAIAEIDYKTKIAAVYLPSVDRCVLAAGIKIDWLNEWNDADENTDAQGNDPEPATYAVTENKVTDLTILPSGMIPYCKGKGTYWMQPENGKSGVGRQRRDMVEFDFTIGGVRIRGCFEW